MEPGRDDICSRAFRDGFIHLGVLKSPGEKTACLKPPLSRLDAVLVVHSPGQNPFRAKHSEKTDSCFIINKRDQRATAGPRPLSLLLGLLASVILYSHLIGVILLLYHFT